MMGFGYPVGSVAVLLSITVSRYLLSVGVAP
jgi:hypothetical protein